MAAGKPKPKAQPVAARVAADPALLAKYQANPGLRAKLPDRFLTPAQRAQRALNAQLNAPVTPGSSLTNRDVARQTQAAADVRYGQAQSQAQQNIGTAQRAVGDIGGFFDQYLREIAQHQANVQAINQATTDQLGALRTTAAGISATPGIGAATQPTDAQAANVRDAIVANLAGTQRLQGDAASRYADTLAHVVGPGEKVQALSGAQGNVSKAQQALTDLLAQRGAFRQQTADQIKSDEAKNILAQTLATGKATASANTASANRQATQRRADEQVNQYGYTAKAWRALSVAERRKIINQDYASKHPPKTPKPTKAPKPTTGVGSIRAQQENGIRAKIDASFGSLKGMILKDGNLSYKDSKGNTVSFPATDDGIITALTSRGMSRDEAAVTLSLYRNSGSLDPAGVKAAHALGLHVGGHYSIAKPKTPTILPGVAGALGTVSNIASSLGGG